MLSLHLRRETSTNICVNSDLEKDLFKMKFVKFFYVVSLFVVIINKKII